MERPKSLAVELTQELNLPCNPETTRCQLEKNNHARKIRRGMTRICKKILSRFV